MTPADPSDSKMKRLCYFCGAPADGEDHLPPRVFFPESKDLAPSMPDMRRQLLKLPACSAHNQALSKDDEYAAFAIVTNITNNGVSRHHISTKVLRALQHSPSLVDTILKDPREVNRGRESVVVFTADRSRLDRVLLRVARGLYFLHHGRPFTRRLFWTSPAMAYHDMTTDPRAAILERAAADLPRDDPQLSYRSGHVGHPSVFTYQLWAAPQIDERLTVWRLVFYEGFIVNVFSPNEGWEP